MLYKRAKLSKSAVAQQQFKDCSNRLKAMVSQERVTVDTLIVFLRILKVTRKSSGLTLLLQKNLLIISLSLLIIMLLVTPKLLLLLSTTTLLVSLMICMIL